MTEQEQKAFTAMREALEQVEQQWAESGWGFRESIRTTVQQALTAANAVSEHVPEVGFGKIVGTYGKVVEWPSLPEQPQATEPQAQGESRLPERDTSKPAEAQGLFRKFDVTRTDGSSAPGGKHHGCEYFVLDVDHDPHSKAALQAYALACASTHPQLSADLMSRYGVHPQATEPNDFSHGYDIGYEAGKLHASQATEPVWRPIESAPKDGTHILAVLPDSDTCYVICWSDPKACIRSELGGEVDEIGWRVAFDGFLFASHEQPSHWMPLPAAPEAP